MRQTKTILAYSCAARGFEFADFVPAEVRVTIAIHDSREYLIPLIPTHRALVHVFVGRLGVIRRENTASLELGKTLLHDIADFCS